jgi:hypothetical protein
MCAVFFGILMARWLLIFALLLLVGVCSAETFLRLRLYRLAEDEDRFTVQAYAGHPEHLLALTVAFAVPRAFHSEALWNESATQGDLPGLYAGLYMSSTDPLARELMPNTGPEGTLLALPRLRMQSLGTAHTWAVNNTLSQLAVELRVSSATRGLLLLGPGSAAWLKARYARFTRNELQLRDSVDLTSGYHALPCRWRDAQGRCVLQQDTYALRVEDRRSGRTHVVNVSAPGRRVILDLDSYTTRLPRNDVAGRLRGDDKGGPSARRIDWIAPGGDSVTWLLARDSDLTPHALQSSDVDQRWPRYAVSEGAEHDDIVIGRQLALRQFAEMVYDSDEATWYVRAADVSETYTLAVRWVIALSLVLQSLLVGRQLLNPDKVQVAHVYTWLYAGGRPAGASHLLHWVYSLALVVTSGVQLILGLLFVGRGADVDLVRLPALRATGTTLSVAASLFALMHMVLVGLMTWRRAQHTLSLEFAASTTYILLGLCGLAGALLPRASQGTCEMLLLSTLLAVLAFLMVFYGTVSFVVVPRRLLFTAKRGNRAQFQQQTLLWIAMAIILTTLALALVFTGGELVFVESVALMSVKSSAQTAVLLAQSLLLLVVVAGVGVVLAETFSADLRRLKTVESVGKSD